LAANLRRISWHKTYQRFSMYNAFMAVAEVEKEPAAKPSENSEAIEQFLSALAARLRLSTFVRLISYCLIGSSAILILLRTLAFCLSGDLLRTLFSWTFLAVVYAAPAVVAYAFAIKQVQNRFDLARFADDRLESKDRIASAVALRHTAVRQPFASRIASDASRIVAQADPIKILPFKWQRPQTVAAIVVVIAFLAFFLPMSPISQFGRTYARLVALKNAGVPTAPNPSNASQQTHNAPTESTRQAQKQAALKNAANLVGKENDRIGKPNGRAKGSGVSGKQSLPVPTQTPSGAAKKSLSAQSGQPDMSNVQTLGDKLRQFADKLAERPMTTGERQQAAQSLNNVSQKLNGMQMPKTQQKLSDAQQDLNDGNREAAINDVRSAAYYADHEGATPPAGQSGTQGSIGKNTVVVPAKNGSGSGNSSAGQGPGNGSEHSSDGSSPDAPGRGGGGGGKASTNSAGGPLPKGDSGANYGGGGTQKPNFGPVRQIDPSKLGKSVNLPPVYLPTSSTSGRSAELPGGKMATGTRSASTVPYVNEQQQYRQAAERGVERDQIPPAYKSLVKKYFTNLSPTH
jgi:type II secretory pathway component PulJ